jgi:hypothetical protein
MAFRIWRAIANTALKLVDFCIRRMELIAEEDKKRENQA